MSLVKVHRFNARRLRKIAAAAGADGISEDLLRAAETRRLDISELLVLGRSLQLGDSDLPEALENAEGSFREVLERDPSNIEARIELGWLLYAVKDDARSAMPYFREALNLLQRLTQEVEQGMQGCAEEIDAAEE